MQPELLAYVQYVQAFIRFLYTSLLSRHTWNVAISKGKL